MYFILIIFSIIVSLLLFNAPNNFLKKTIAVAALLVLVMPGAVAAAPIDPNIFTNPNPPIDSSLGGIDSFFGGGSSQTNVDPTSANSGKFVPLVTIPNLQFDDGTTLSTYVNAVFSLIISLAVLLAALRIVTGGFKYMTSEAVGAKGDARETIQNAALGLILLLSSWLILTTINPQILDLSALKFDNLQQDDKSAAILQQDKKDFQANLDTLVGDYTYDNKARADKHVRDCYTFGGSSSSIMGTQKGTCRFRSRGICQSYTPVTYTVRCTR